MINIDPFIEADVTETNPILSQSIMRNHDQLTFDVFVCVTSLASITIPTKLCKLTISEHPRRNMASRLDNPRTLETRLSGRPHKTILGNVV